MCIRDSWLFNPRISPTFREESTMIRYSFVALVVLSACGQVDESAPVVSDAELLARVTEGSPDAVGTLAMLNDCSTDLHVVDDVVALDARTAKAIINHRDGYDHTCGTGDDDKYGSIAE